MTKSKYDPPYSDPLLDQVRRTREELVRKHGGLRGWVEHLQQVQANSGAKLISFQPKTLKVKKKPKR